MRSILRFWMSLLNVLEHPGLHRDSMFLAAATIVSGLGSVLYWKLITQRFSVELVGLASAGIASAAFLTSLSGLGLSAGLIRFIPRQDAAVKSALIHAVVLISLGAASIVSLLFFAGRSWWASNLFPASVGLPYILTFLLLLVTSLQMNINTAVIQAERRTPYLLVQSMVINAVQIAGAWWVAVALGVTGILFTYTLPILVVALLFYFALPRLARFVGTSAALPDRGLLRDLLRYSLSTQVFNVIWSLPAIVFPLIVLARLGPQANAMLALSWFAYAFLTVIPNSTAVALLVDGVHQPNLLPRLLWDALVINLVLLVPVVLGIVALTPWLLGFFGRSYLPATHLLRLLSISILPVAINGLYITLWRIQKQVLMFNLFAFAVTLVAVLSGSIFVYFQGVDGVGWGWLLGQTAFALPVLALIVRRRWLIGGAQI